VAEEKKNLKLVVVGGVAAGPKAASKVIRLLPEADVTIVEKGEFLSYAGCGLPYYVSGTVKEQRELMCTPIGVVRDPVFFRNVKNVHVLSRTEATQIDRRGKRVRVVNDGATDWLSYDKLLLATGGTPIRPSIPGIELDGIFTLHRVEDAEGIRQALAEEEPKDVVVVGGGLIGVEMVEALTERAARVTVVEMLPQVLPMLDWEMADLVRKHMESHGVKVLTGEAVAKFKGEGKVSKVVTRSHELPCDMAILAVGVKPNASLAEAAGLETSSIGAICVDDHLRTGDPDIYAAGDCVECRNLITGKPCYVPLGSTANKQGRVAAVNICGGDEVFPGVLGTTVCKVFDYAVGRTGLSEREARSQDYDAATCLAPAPDRAHYYPTAKPLMLKLVADRKSRRLLGVQAVGPGEAAKRVDVAATAITAGMTVDQVANLDLSYAPPYAPAMDNLITGANVLRNKFDGRMHGITPMEVKRKLDAGDPVLLLDVRSPAEIEQIKIEPSVKIPLGVLRARLRELPRDREIVTFCKISLRGYEAALILKAAGFEHVKVMDGGIVMWPYEKIQT
jgi:NADPH-dependent 2,4-dienoyl-CoA reductase/sulfur reductase-like enzyme/rhodanese-related sulfurtransferase